MFTWITYLLEQYGYAGIGLLMFLENVFPPIPSELIMPLAGFQAERGDLNLALVILSGSAGSIAGASIWYFVGRWIGERRLTHFASRHGRLLTLDVKQVARVNRWFDRHNEKAVLTGRLVPAVRTLISVPAGLFEMKLPRFLIYSTIGSIAWTALLALSGQMLGEQYGAVQDYLDPVANVVVAAIILIYLYRVATWRQDSG